MMMKHNTLMFLSFIALPVCAADFSAYVPKDWKIVKSATGDLNGDGKPDAVLVLQGRNQSKIIANEGMGSPELDTNPRMLKVLFKQEKGYRTAVENTTLIPSEGSMATPCLADPFSDVSIDKGRLKVSLEYWLSCGSWWMSSSEYIFRYENKRFRLIGYEYDSLHRATGEIEGRSDNYLTGKRKTITGGNEFEPSRDKPKSRWRNLEAKPYYLDEPYRHEEE